MDRRVAGEIRANRAAAPELLREDAFKFLQPRFKFGNAPVRGSGSGEGVVFLLRGLLQRFLTIQFPLQGPFLFLKLFVFVPGKQVTGPGCFVRVAGLPESLAERGLRFVP